MAWEARLGLKRTLADHLLPVQQGLNGLGSPSGIETHNIILAGLITSIRLNGLGSPSEGRNYSPS
jgi:hypothetical protein